MQHSEKTILRADEVDLSETLARVATELDNTAAACTALQWSISTLLDKVHHPDLAEEIHMLQDIDRMQQTLVDIAAVVRVAANVPDRIALSRTAVHSAIRLESLRGRIGLAVISDNLNMDAPEPLCGETDVTWL
jgi:hypothetical protein